MHCSGMCSWPDALIFFHSISANKSHCCCSAGDNDAQMLSVLWGLACWTDAKWSLSPLIPNSHWMGFISAALPAKKEIRIRIASSAPSWHTDTAKGVSFHLSCPPTWWCDLEALHWLHRQHGQLIWTGHTSFRPLEVTCDASQEIGFFSPETYRQCEVCIRKKTPCKWNLHFSEIFLPAKDKNVCLRHMDMINSRESHENVGPEENKDIKPQSWLMLFNYLSVW